MSLASYFVRSSARLMPPRSTARSKPTRSSTVSTIFRTALAMSQPTTRIAMNATALGMKSSTDLHMSARASPMSACLDREGFRHDVPPVAWTAPPAYPVTGGARRDTGRQFSDMSPESGPDLPERPPPARRSGRRAGTHDRNRPRHAPVRLRSCQARSGESPRHQPPSRERLRAPAPAAAARGCRARPPLGRHPARPARGMGPGGTRRGRPGPRLAGADGAGLRRRSRAALQRRVRRTDRRPAPGGARPARRRGVRRTSGTLPGVGEVHRARLPHGRAVPGDGRRMLPG